MPFAYDTAQTFATEAGVYRNAGNLVLTDTSTPSNEDGKQWAYEGASIIVMVTDDAGQREEPPASSVSDSYLGTLLKGANACGCWSLPGR